MIPKSEPCIDCQEPNYLYDLSPWCPACFFRHEQEKRVA